MAKRLFIGNLPYSATEQQLTEIFSEAGKVESVSIITNRETGRSKGFGFVEMSSDAEAAEAVAKLNGHSFDGRPLVVSEARPQVPREQVSRS